MMQEVKAQIRKLAHAKRAEAFAQGQGDAATHLAAYLAPFAGQVVSGYLPMRSEIDPLGALARHQGQVGMPVIIGRGQPLQFRHWTPQSKLIEGSFKAMIPVEGDWLTPQIVIVPMLAFDARGYRLGYGGGFYDRTLELLRAKGPVIALGFAFAAQEMAEVPIEATDQKLDAIVTEQGLRRFG